MASKKVRVRFAPSPTGTLHIGGARTALFNWIFARSKGGEFVLRIEDTDKERSKKDFEDDIIESLKWLGLEWDEFYRQRDRIDTHKKYLKKLIDEGWVYHCFCTREELEVERKAMLSQGLAPIYSGKCRKLNKEDVTKRIENGEDSVLRFKVRETKLTFKDIIRGEISFDTGLMGDIVIAKSLDRPLYHFAVVVDDALTNITHVIRGEEHISNTPRQILIMNALGFEPPKFAHLPIILNPDRTKMSKRFSDTAMSDYIKDGYLPDAMTNFLTYLGWHPEEDKDIMSIDEIIKEFDLKRVQKGGAVFNIDKLDWYNNQYIQNQTTEEFTEAVKKYLPAEWRLDEAIVQTVKNRVKKLSEVKELVSFYFELTNYDTELLKWRGGQLKDASINLRKGLEMIQKIPQNKFEKDYIEKVMLEQIPKENRGDILWPLRVALSGKKESPSPFEIMGALGKEEVERRVMAAVEKTGMLNI